MSAPNQDSTANQSASDQASTLQSFIDKGVGMAQSTLGSLTGSQADTNQGEQKKADADAKDALSHVGGNVAGHSVSAHGVQPNHPDRQAGAWNQTIGSAKEFIGNLTGAEGWKKAGEQQNAEGKAQEASGQLNDLTSGVANRLTGAVGSAAASLTGDKAELERRQAQHDAGKTLQRGAEADIQKQAPPQQ